MKKLYNKKGKVHPTPPLVSDHLLTFLPAAILALTSALSPQDKEVLAYLISCSTGTPSTGFPKAKKNTQNTQAQKSSNGLDVNGFVGGGQQHPPHPPLFHCNCFLCYTSYWVRWDSSPNRQLIHDIIDAFEDELEGKTKKTKIKKDRKKKGCNEGVDDLMKTFDEESVEGRVESSELESAELGGGDDSDVVGKEGEEEELDKGSVRKFMSFIGERIWGVWGQ